MGALAAAGHSTGERALANGRHRPPRIVLATG
jgi:hypothetical protein